MKIRGKKHEGKGGGVLDEGDYILQVHKAAKGKSNNGDMQLELEFLGADSATGKRHFWKNLILEHSNEKTVEISTEQFESLVFCTLGEVDFNFPKDLKKLTGKKIGVHMTATILTKKEKKKNPTWKDKNEIKYFFAAEGGGDKKKKKDQPY